MFFRLFKRSIKTLGAIINSFFDFMTMMTMVYIILILMHLSVITPDVFFTLAGIALIAGIVNVVFLDNRSWKWDHE